MSGGGIGGTLGGLAGLALAPETGGLSLAIPAATGAAGAFAGGELTHDKSPLLDALLGGVGGGLGGALDAGGSLGISNSAGLFGDGAAGADGIGTQIATSDLAPLADSTGITGVNAATPSASLYGGAGQSSQLAGWSPSLDGSAPAIATNTAGNAGTGIGAWLGKQNPLALALAGNTGLSAIQSLMSPLPKYSVQGNRNSVLASDPNFSNSALPKYTMQNTATPYQGNWYNYGYSPQPVMYNAQPVAAAQGGLIGYKHGGSVQKFAMGGSPMVSQAAPASASPLAQNSPVAVPPSPLSSLPVTPGTLNVAHKVGVAIGQHIKNKMPHIGPVNGAGGGQDDAIPAKLSDGEFVVPADAVAHLGDGSSKAGGAALTHMVKQVRAAKAVKGFPPKAKSPLAYIPKGNKA